MSSKTILGLDLGTNSIGWALVNQDFNEKAGKILGMGTRVIPMSQDILGEFDKGNSISQTADRTKLRSARRLRERYLLRRQRLYRVLNILGLLPEHFAQKIDFKTRPGQFKDTSEPKLAYDKTGFIFQTSFAEMLEDFKINQPELLNKTNRNGEPAKIPYDWTLYYLRKKALTHKIEKAELAWVVLNFNIKRGYYQREDDSTDKEKDFEIVSSLVSKVTKGEKDKKYEKYWYDVQLENGLNYRAAFYSDISHWIGQKREFIVKTTTLKDSSVKQEISFLPTFEEIEVMDKALKDKMYAKIKIKTQLEIDKSGKTVGEYIYDTLLQNPNQKIKGKLVRTIERKYYRDELKTILKRQIELHPELQKEELFVDCIRELYRHNESHQNNLSSKDLLLLIVDDIIFYQRPLRTQKSSISSCSLESRKFTDPEGNEQVAPLRVVPKSNPYYQEFRIWKWIRDLSIYRRADEVNVTSDFFKSVKDYEKLFDELSKRKEIKQDALLKFLVEQTGLKGKAASAEANKYRWNFVEDKVYPMNETYSLIATRLEKVNSLPALFLSKMTEFQLWHIIYSITDKTEYEKALKTFARKHKLDEASFVEHFRKFPPFKSEYASYSEKAIKKLLPLMRAGKFWSWEAIDNNTRARIEKLTTGEYDETISPRVREKTKGLTEPHHFQSLPDWVAKYLVYGRHAEATDLTKWTSANDLDNYLTDFKQHSLRNPIVEQVMTETLRVVRDIWQQYGRGAKDFFNEIHIELGREMKKTADERKGLSKQISENENTNLRLKALLVEMMQQGDVENVRPHSPTQLEILKIYEDGVLNSDIEIPDDIQKISKTAQPSGKELLKYKLWLEQKYRSPYTGETIPLSKLFTSAYEIEHIIPQSRYFDDSFSNKVICESAVNKLKDNQLALEFIKNHHGEKVQTGLGNTVTVLEFETYQEFVKKHYAKSRGKKTKLLLEEIPEQMIERQLNDTRYISKFISSVLSSIVRESENDDGVNSKNIIAGNGKITAELRHDWGLDDVWNDLILPRFERMNELTKSTAFTAFSKIHQKYLPTVPLELSKGFQKKRIDHRHHAVDALVIACATRDHINLLNNLHANSDHKRYDLQHKLRKLEKVKYFNSSENRMLERTVPREFLKPWASFTADAKAVLETIIISFKQNLRVINKASNKYESFKDETGNLRLGKDGKPKKGLIPQTKGDSWAIRKSMHKDTISGLVSLQRVKVAKGKITTATRKAIDTTFDVKAIESITDTGIQKILKNYLVSKGGNPEIAFSPEGLEEMNKTIEKYNDGKPHKPIIKARVYELGNKFSLGQTANKRKKYAEADKGTNLFFAVYWDSEKKKRNYESIPLNEVIEHQKWRATLPVVEQRKTPMIPVKRENGEFLFSLSPNDLVFVPSNQEVKSLAAPQIPNRIYKMVSCTGRECHFVSASISSLIKPYDAKSKIGELGSLNKLETTLDLSKSIRIKETCLKITVDRIGNVIQGLHLDHVPSRP
ncbi:MAG: type II CRISPR RNA-guided endonuclease Cas9 [Cyclobacteriaceae bacterium]|jgi:CRISPR-associated endonuclease Csn1|nr:type II CRISPR RNA-guided endonuclease Cas9 [Cyclobacteriaceae bacterium]